jgi:hypothetical protein
LIPFYAESDRIDKMHTKLPFCLFRFKNKTAKKPHLSVWLSFLRKLCPDQIALVTLPERKQRVQA